MGVRVQMLRASASTIRARSNNAVIAKQRLEIVCIRLRCRAIVKDSSFAVIHHFTAVFTAACTLGCTPAMRAGVTDHVCSVEEIVGLLDFAEKSSN